MSILSTRPRVKSVVNSRIISSAHCIADVLSERDCAQRSLVEQALSVAQKPPAINAVQSVFSLLAGLRKRQEEKKETLKLYGKLPDLQAAKVSVLAALAEQPLLIHDKTALKVPLFALQTARTVQEVSKAQERLTKAITFEHNKVFAESLKLACTNAYRKIGFRSIETLAGFNNTIRIIAGNATGKTLVSEITIDPQREPSLATEIVSGCDSTSEQLLNAFDNALEEEGVRAGAPVRKGTGGICELFTAREFVRRKPRHLTQTDPAVAELQIIQSKTSQPVKYPPSRRTQKLNRSKAKANTKE